MKIAHILRKYDPRAWGGTESVVHQLAARLCTLGIESSFFYPALAREACIHNDPLRADGHVLRPFRTCVPIIGLTAAQREQFIAVGGNVLSFDLAVRLFMEHRVSVIHSHTLNRLGGIARTIARLRNLPFVVTIHGGYLDLPAQTREELAKARRGGLEWGKAFGWLVGARRVVSGADAVLTTNPREAELLRVTCPTLRVEILPHGVPMHVFSTDHRAEALRAFPMLRHRRVLLLVGRIDPVKNQGFVVEHLPVILQRHPDVVLVLSGAGTHATYAAELAKRIDELGVTRTVLQTGGLPPCDPRLIGLYQIAEAVLLPSLSETFGLVLLEAWAAGTTVIASRTSGAQALIQQAHNGWLFEHGDASAMLQAIETVLNNASHRAYTIQQGQQLVLSTYDASSVAQRLAALYAELSDRYMAGVKKLF